MMLISLIISTVICYMFTTVSNKQILIREGFGPTTMCARAYAQNCILLVDYILALPKT
jgi:hypothetical protein